MASAAQRAAPVVGAGLLGLVVCLPFSWRPSLWTDEAATISAATRSLPELYAMAHNIDAVHAVYYAFMHAWLLVVPPEAFLLRLPSAVAVALAAAGVYLIAARLAGSRTAAAAAVAFVLLPRTTWMGIEARPYAFSALLAVAATWLLLVAVSEGASTRGSRVLTRRPGLFLAAYAVVVGLGMAVHIYVALLLVAHGISLLLSPQVGWRLRFAFLAAGLVGVAIASPVIWAAVHQTGQLGGGRFGPLWWVRSVWVNQWFLGQTPTLGTGADAESSVGLDALWKPAAVVLALVSWLIVLAGVASRRRSVGLLRWALPWIVVPTVVICTYSIGVSNFYNPRYFSYTTAGLALLVGHGLTRLRPAGLIAGLVTIAILAAPVYVSQRQLNAKSSTDWSQVAGFVAQHRSAGGMEGIYFGPRYAVEGTTVNQTARGVAVAYPDAFSGLRDVTLLRTPVADANLTGTSLRLADATDRLAGLSVVWVVRRQDNATIAADDATLAAAGFSPALRWSGPLDTVTQFVRS
ncbi:MAG TPA: glycosyltransferase family 39 protein [Propionibacteriaceae bacterium]